MQNRTREYFATRHSNPDDPVDMAPVTCGVDGVTKVTANGPARMTSADEMAVRTRPIGQFLHIRTAPPTTSRPFAAIYAGGERSIEGDERHTADSRRG
jgi:hypothetical protein